MVREVDNTFSSQFDSDTILYLDTETSTHNKGHPFDPRNKLVSSVTLLNGTLRFGYYTDPDFISALKEEIAKADTIVGFNIKFDIHHLRNVGIEVDHLKVWDLQLGEFILSGQENRFASLKDTLESYQLAPKQGDVVADMWAAGIATEDIPIEILKAYNISDVAPLPELFKIQYSLLSEKQRRLVFLDGEDLKVLADIERNGVLWDADKAGVELNTLNQSLKEYEDQLSVFLPEGLERAWFNWDSGDQLSAFLYGGTITYDYSIPVTTVAKSGAKKGEEVTRNKWHTQEIIFPQQFVPIKTTELAKTKDKVPPPQTRFYQTDAPTLAQLKARTKDQKRVLELLNQRSGAIKVVEMIASINAKIVEKNWQDNYIHPQYNQNQVITGRLSSSQPNLQNTPPEIDALLRSRYENNNPC